MPAAQLLVEMAAATRSGVTFGGRYLAPADLYLHPTAGRTSWVYCERGLPSTSTPNVIADRLCPTSAWVRLSTVHKHAPNAKRRGQQRKAAACAQRDWRVERRAAARLGCHSEAGFIFRPHAPGVLGTCDRRRLGTARAAVEVAAIHRLTVQRWEEAVGVPGLPIPPSFGTADSAGDFTYALRSGALRPHDPFLNELRAVHGARAVDATRPQPGAPPLLMVADIARHMSLSGAYEAGLVAAGLRQTGLCGDPDHPDDDLTDDSACDSDSGDDAYGCESRTHTSVMHTARLTMSPTP